jgi:nucleoside-diphosphate-sugar epimerase
VAPDAEERSYVGDLENRRLLEAALSGVDAVAYVAMGQKGSAVDQEAWLNESFNVNVRGVYRVLGGAIDAGVKTFVYASSLDVYQKRARGPIDESVPPDAYNAYGLTKYLGEDVCRMLSGKAPEMSVLALRLVHPHQPRDWRPPTTSQLKGVGTPFDHGLGTGPEDTRELFRRALRLRAPGFHVVQATGDLRGDFCPNARAEQILGWKPKGC